ncbi:MAG: class I SAM-dependent methyltransferase [Methanobacterium sp.]
MFKKLKYAVDEKIIFLNQFAKNPKRVGSIIPSSNFLIQTMIEPIVWDDMRTIVELGAGTGVITRYIEEMRHPDSQSYIFEIDNRMRQRLIDMYPDIQCHKNAVDLSAIMFDMNRTVDCILSGLPFANFDQQLRNQILDAVVDSLKPGGAFITFQYSLQMKQQFEKRFSQVNIKFSPLNIPPAFVYFCYK